MGNRSNEIPEEYPPQYGDEERSVMIENMEQTVEAKGTTY